MLNLDKILAKHAAWLRGEPGGQRADLCGADLCGARLCGASLRGADLREASLCWADLRGADLRGANLSEADLHGANLHGVNLSEANLSRANLDRANLSEAHLRGADLRGADLRGANLSGRIPLHADTARRYVLYVLPEVRGGPRFVAGCRNFSVAEALSHWGPESPRSQPEYLAAIKQWLAENGYVLTDVIEAVK